jgi:hypothetical protein
MQGFEGEIAKRSKADIAKSLGGLGKLHLDIGTHQALDRARRDAIATFRDWHSAEKRDGAYRMYDQFIVK